MGNTAHFMTEGYDGDPIIESEWYEFPKNASYQSIRIKVSCWLLFSCERVKINRSKNMKQSNAIKQDLSKGSFGNPIPDDKMEKVIQKVLDHNYKYQRL